MEIVDLQQAVIDAAEDTVKAWFSYAIAARLPGIGRDVLDKCYENLSDRIHVQARLLVDLKEAGNNTVNIPRISDVPGLPGGEA